MSRAREFADLAGSADAGGITGRNLIINGAMNVAQRGTSLSMAHDGTDDSYLIDRFFFAIVGNHGELDGTYAQVDDHPLSTNGKSLKWTTGTAEAAYATNEYVYLTQKIEAQNLQHLNYGNSNAQSVTLSFYVKSSITGTFAVGFYKEDSTTRIFNQTYTINSANTWEKKSITFAGDTAGGGIVNDNGAGLWTTWHLAAGSGATGGGSVGAWKNYGGLTDWADGQATNAVTTTASATWQITDCQLEVGEQATPFEHRSFTAEEISCNRYYYEAPALYRGHSMNVDFVTVLRTGIQFPVRMRASPTVTNSGVTSGFTIGTVLTSDQSHNFEISKSSTTDFRPALTSPNFKFDAEL